MRVIASCAAIALLAFAGKPAVSAQSCDVTALAFTQGGLALNNAGVVVGGFSFQAKPKDDGRDPSPTPL